MISFRWEEHPNINEIKELIDVCFGNSKWYDYESLTYVTANHNGKIIGFAGITTTEDYDGTLISLVCVSPAYRKQGVATKLISMISSDNLYVKCWKWPTRNNVNLDYAMKTLGFQVAIKDYRKYDSRYLNICKDCHFYTDNCKCTEDLYVKK